MESRAIGVLSAGTISEPGDMIIYGYNQVDVEISDHFLPRICLKNQIFELQAKVSWLACKELCVPGNEEVLTSVGGPETSTGSVSQIVPKGRWPQSGKPPFEVAISGKGKIRLVSFTGSQGATYNSSPIRGFQIRGRQ